MKPTKLIIQNIGRLAGETVIEINKPLVLFYGEIKQGKTTILNCVRWVCGGEFPADIITHGADEGSIELHFENALISRSFYRSKQGDTRARPVTFIRNGKPVSQPVNEIKRLLNPFLLDQDFLRNKTELERKRYFIELFDVDTSALDSELLANQQAASRLRAKIDGYGTINLSPVERVDIKALEAEAAKIRENNKALEATYEGQCEEYNNRLNLRSENEQQIKAADEEIKRVEERLSSLRSQRVTLAKRLEEIPMLPEPKEPQYTSTEGIELKLREAGAINVRAEQFEENKKRAEAKKEEEKRLLDLEARAREIKAAKQKLLKDISDKCKVKGLSFDDEGNFVYENTTAGMISDSQIMRLSSELSALYPEGFGLDLIDRAESLGRSIFEFVDKAKAENKSILATIVGEKPAKVPENVGVFVVENGKLSTPDML